MNRRGFQRLALVRLAEASSLVEGRKYDGAYYLAGYAIECALKAILAKRIKWYEFPPKLDIVRTYYSHSFNDLLRVAELLQLRDRDVKANGNLGDNWAIVSLWKTDRRYQRNTRSEAVELIEAIASEPDGVLAWIRQFW